MEDIQSVVCDCGYRSRMELEKFRSVALKESPDFFCPKCGKNLTDLIYALYRAISGQSI